MEKKISNERKQAYVEVLEILKHMDKKYIKKIPTKLLEFFKDNCSTEYKFILDRPIQEKKLKKETINLLAMINFNYWCEDEKHKKELLKKYFQNEIKLQEELSKKYSYENLFKSGKQKQQYSDGTTDKETLVTKYKETFITRIINIIKKIFIKRG